MGRRLHSFNLGDRVTVFQMSASKGLLIEGTASITGIVGDVDEQYVVRFDNELGDYENVEDCPTYERFVDRDGQEAPEQYVRDFNRKIGKA